MIRRLTVPVTLLLVAVLIFIALKMSKPETVQVEKPAKAWLVDTTAITFKDIAPEVTIYGRVETPREASLTAALSADVESVEVLEGAEVTEGQLLIRLDDTDTSLLIIQREADVEEIDAMIASENERYQRDQKLLEHEKILLELAEKSVARAQKLEQSRLASQSSLDDARAAKQRQLLTLNQLQHDLSEHPVRLAQLKASRKRAQALLEQARVDLSRTLITSPFSGRIAKLNVAVGDRVRAGDQLITVYDLANLEVRAQLPGRYTSQIRSLMAQNADLTATAVVDDQDLSFSLVRLSGEVRADSGGIDGLFKFSDDRHVLALGTFIELNLKLAIQRNVVELPFTSLYGLDRIYRVENGFLQAIQVERIGEYRTPDGDKRLLVRSDKLRSGDEIVTTQMPNAISGLKVEVTRD